MKKQFKKVSLALIFAMAVSFIAPAARVAEAAAQKTFTYAEQQTGDKVTTLVMDKGEKVDLKFEGVSNWKTYSYKWVSSNTKVAVVDSAGVITAVNSGVATIKLTVSGGDGTVYTSTGVTVYVDLDQSVAVGTASQAEIKSYTMKKGTTATLKANGLKDNIGGRYTFHWTSTDSAVATVNENGVITAKAAGLTVIQLTVKKVFSGKTMQAMPIALQVTEEVKATPTPAPTATPVPTQKPNATAIPTPTAVPNATATPTPTPTIPAGSYSIAVTTDRSLTVTFSSKVSYKAEDITLSEIIEADDEDILFNRSIKSVELDTTGKIMVITTEDPLKTARYNIKIGASDAGRTFPVSIGVPNRVDLVYSCFGQDNVAYAYDDEIGIDVPVQLDYKLYYGNIDVTESYENSGHFSFELVSPLDSEKVMLDNDQLYFYAAKQSAVASVIYTYYNEKGEEKELKDTANIVSQALGNYKVTGVVKWTIIDTDKNEPIDWDNPVTKVISGKENFKVVALLADSYGYFYSTDERGVDESKKIYSVENSDTLFGMKGYSYSFNSTNDDDFYMSDSGELYTYNAKDKAATYINLYNPDDGSERKLGAWQFTILAESKLNSVKIEATTVTLVTEAVNNEERFCEIDIPVELYDQYNYKWTGDANLTASCNIAVINDGIDEAVTLTPDGENGNWNLHIDGKALASLSNRTSVTLTITDEDSKKKDTVIVALKNPAGSNGAIEVKTWEVGMKESKISFGDGNLSEVNAQAVVEVYQVSKTGAYNVGLLYNGTQDENGNTNTIVLQTAKNLTFKADNCSAGEIYVLVLAPNGSVVPVARDSGSLGVYQDPATGEIVVNITNFNGATLEYLAEGQYTVKITKINKINGTSVSKLMKQTTFTVVDNTKDVTIAGYNGTRTSHTVNGENDPEIKDIVLELFKFKLGDAAWTSIDESMITNVTYTVMGNNRIRITGIEFAVPADVKNNTSVTYYKKLTLSKTITIGANN